LLPLDKEDTYKKAIIMLVTRLQVEN